jgi:hypothetical protein
MKYIIFLICLVLVVIVGVRLFINYSKVEKAKLRVKHILNGLHEGPGKTTSEVQKAVSQWYQGSPFISDRNTLARASDQFEAWLRKKNLYIKITRYEITEATLVKGSDPPVVIVSCTIEGKPLKMQVPKDDRISWIE